MRRTSYQDIPLQAFSPTITQEETSAAPPLSPKRMCKEHSHLQMLSLRSAPQGDSNLINIPLKNIPEKRNPVSTNIDENISTVTYDYVDEVVQQRMPAFCKGMTPHKQTQSSSNPPSFEYMDMTQSLHTNDAEHMDSDKITHQSQSISNYLEEPKDRYYNQKACKSSYLLNDLVDDYTQMTSFTKLCSKQQDFQDDEMTGLGLVSPYTVTTICHPPHTNYICNRKKVQKWPSLNDKRSSTLQSHFHLPHAVGYSEKMPRVKGISEEMIQDLYDTAGRNVGMTLGADTYNRNEKGTESPHTVPKRLLYLRDQMGNVKSFPLKEHLYTHLHSNRYEQQGRLGAICQVIKISRRYSV